MGLGWKVATAEVDALSITVQVGALPVHAPDHPENKASLPGCADSVIAVPSGRVVLQLPAQTEVCPFTVALSGPLPAPDLE